MHTSAILRRLLILLGLQPSYLTEDDGGGAVAEAADEVVADDAGQDDAAGAGDEPQAVAEESSTADADDADEITVSIGEPDKASAEEEEQARAPEWVRELRKSNRELVRRQRELEAENQRLKGGPQQTIQLGPKPTLAACDYDEERFDAELSAWHDRKRAVDQQAEQQQRAQQQAQQAWQTKLNAYAEKKAALKVRDFEEAEAQVQDSLSTIQQGIILNGAENPALLVYALGRNPKKAAELAKETDPVRFAFAVARLETQLKITPTKRPAPAPERAVRGSAPSSAAGDLTLARLQAEADKTGDRSKVAQYLRSKSRQAA